VGLLYWGGCCWSFLQPAPSVTSDAAELEPAAFLNPINLAGLALGTAVAGIVLLQKKESEVRGCR